MERNLKKGVLYISYDGILEPLGQSQVLNYLRLLAEGRRIHLISFEKNEDLKNSKLLYEATKDVFNSGINWHPLRYHKYPSALATSWDIAHGIIVGAWLIVRYGLRIVHARSYVPSVMALVLKRVTGVKYLFDMRGFWADERVDGGLWRRNGSMFRITKLFERHLLLSADHVVSLTQTAEKELKNFEYLKRYSPPITVIPTCADLSCFRPIYHNQEKKGFILGYVGSAGTWYLFDKVAKCFANLLQMQPEAHLLIINRGQHEYIKTELGKAGVPDASVEIMAINHDDVPAQMARMDAGIFFYRPSYSRLACAPTKLAEFLGCGIPCMTNVGVGDMDLVLEGERVGVALKTFNETEINYGLTKLLQMAFDPDTRNICVATAHKFFSLDMGVSRYSRIYEQLER